MRPKIALVCTVWGAEFTDFFCQYSLASLLTATNLPEASTSYDFTLLLYTLECDLPRMQKHPNFRRLAELIEIKPVFLETLPSGARRGHWIQWHHALLSADEYSSFILLIPDCVYANQAIAQIANLLNTKDIVYYCIPQVCLELVLPYLDSIMQPGKGSDPSNHLNLSALDVASLFIRFINPRYAVALEKPDYFVTHPEYVLRAAKGKIEIHELTCHALAIRSRAKDLSYTFNPASHSTEIGFLDLLAVGVEYTFKYFEQYFRWPTSNMQLSRCSSLASWSYHFNALGAHEYNQTTSEISVTGLAASAQQRKPLTSGRMKYGRAVLQYHATLYGIYAGPSAGCPTEVRKAIALAISLPGFRKALMAETGPLTILLPASEGILKIFELVCDLGDPRQLLKLLLMHVLPGQLVLRPGQSFVLERIPERPSYRPRFRAIEDELLQSLPDVVGGKILSQATVISDNLIAYSTNITYGTPQLCAEKFLAGRD
jgi:hypothetical protein